jgi:hypothetical protein
MVVNPLWRILGAGRSLGLRLVFFFSVPILLTSFFFSYSLHPTIFYLFFVFTMYYKPNATLAISPSLYSRPLYVNGVLKKLSFLRPDPKAHLLFNLSLTFSSDFISLFASFFFFSTDYLYFTLFLLLFFLASCVFKQHLTSFHLY